MQGKELGGLVPAGSNNSLGRFSGLWEQASSRPSEHRNYHISGFEGAWQIVTVDTRDPQKEAIFKPSAPNVPLKIWTRLQILSPFENSGLSAHFKSGGVPNSWPTGQPG